MVGQRALFSGAVQVWRAWQGGSPALSLQQRRHPGLSQQHIAWRLCSHASCSRLHARAHITLAHCRASGMAPAPVNIDPCYAQQRFVCSRGLLTCCGATAAVSDLHLHLERVQGVDGGLRGCAGHGSSHDIVQRLLIWGRDCLWGRGGAGSKPALSLALQCRSIPVMSLPSVQDPTGDAYKVQSLIHA